MPVIYKGFKSVLKNKEGKQLFYPRVVLTGNVGTDQIAREIADYCSLTPGDTKNTIDNIVKVLTTPLQASESVTLDGLGSFRMAMKSTGKGVATEDAVSATQATLTIRFQPAVKRNLDRTVATRAMVTGVKCVRFDAVSGSGNGGTGNGGTGGSGNGGGSEGGGEETDPLG